MAAEPSLRWRLVFGSVLWAVGLVAIAILVSTAFALRHPGLLLIAHTSLLLVVAFGCVVAGLTQLRRALRPFDELRSRLADVRDGRSHRVEGVYPREVQPLVDDLNALLDHRERAVRRAVAKAGDLAHGLKTPLAVLAQEAERAEAAGHREEAAILGQQVARMQRQVEYHLAHARAAASGAAPGARCVVKESAEALSRTLRRLHADRGIAIDVNVPADLAVRGQGEDLEEMLGNLLDNACKWARSRVEISASRDAARVLITVDDDGPGLDASLWESVLQRGVRADEAAPGSGFGLAIVRDLAELHGGTIALDRSPLGGLRAALSLPAAGGSE